MQAFLQYILPICAIIIAGYSCGMTKIINKQNSEAINGFVYYFALPALLILFLSDTKFQTIYNTKIIITFLVPQLIIMSATIIIAKTIFKLHTSTEIITQSMAAIFSNTGYLGIPLMIAAFGYANADVAILTTIINGAVILPMTLCLIAAAEQTQKGTHPITSLIKTIPIIIKLLITNPLLIATIIGTIMSVLEIRSNGAIRIFLETSGNAAPAAALFAIGLFLATNTQFGTNKNSPHKAKLDHPASIEILYITIIKIIIHPLLTYIVATQITQLDPRNTAAVIIMAALPTGGLVFLVAQKIKCYEHKSAAIILLSTILAIITVSFLIQYYTPTLIS